MGLNGIAKNWLWKKIDINFNKLHYLGTAYYTHKYSETCIVQTLNKPKSCINRTLNKVLMQEIFTN